MAINFELNIQNFLKQAKYDKDCTNTSLVLEYYRTRGITDNTSTNEWLIMVAEKKIPVWRTTYETIKKYRKQNN